MQKISFLLAFMLLTGCRSVGCVQEERVATENEARWLRPVEPYVMSALARLKSPSIRNSGKQNIGEGGLIESRIAMLGMSHTDVGTDSLINLLGVGLDAGGSEELGCHIADRGKSILPRFEALDAKKLAEHCRELFFELRKGELKDINDVPVESICHSSEEIERNRNAWIEGIKESDEGCPW
jgi:hypothetical protein